MPKKIKILLAKVGLDPHDKGIKLLARTLKEVGAMEVFYTGLYRTVEEVVDQALQEGVDLVGLSVHTGMHMTFFPDLRMKLDEKGGGNIILIGGGVIPGADIANLKARGGVAEIFSQYEPIQEVIDWINKTFASLAESSLELRRGGDELIDIAAVSEQEMIEKVRQLAKDNFRKGLNCAESVYTALLDAELVDFAPESVALTTAFGGGLGLSGGMCGSLVAAAMAIGAVHGRRNPGEGTQEEKVDRLYGNPGLYRFFNQLPHKFEEKFGSTQCVDLNKDFPIWFDKDRFRKCMGIVVDTAEMAVGMIYQGDREGYNQAFGKNMAGKE